MTARRHIVHVVYRFAIGGLENVIVQLINRLPADRYTHTVLALTTISDFRNRVTNPAVRFVELNKPAGHAIPLYPTIFRLFRELKPDVVHTCNLAALEIAPIAWLAGVPRRIHAEHGWDAHDPDGTNPRYRRLRRLYKPFINHYVGVSQDIDRYLAEAIAIPPERRSLIANGVDIDRFSPPPGTPPSVAGCPFIPRHHWLIGTVGRLQTVKNQPYLAHAFVRFVTEHPEARQRARLVIVGDGPLRTEVEAVLEAGGVRDLAWLPGARDDIPDILRMLDCFTLPSQAEGTSCTLQEAMATGLPCIATAVGGTPALVREGISGQLVPPDYANAFAAALWSAYSETGATLRKGAAARQQALSEFAIDGMVVHYDRLFSESLR